MKTRITSTKSIFKSLNEPNFQGVNRLFVLAFEDDAQRTNNKIYCLPNAEIRDYYVMIDGKIFFDQPVKKAKKKTQENITKIVTAKADGYTRVCLLDYAHFRDNYKMITIDLSKQQVLDADPRSIQQINFTANLDRENNTRIILEEAKETVFSFSRGTVNVLQNNLIFINIKRLNTIAI